MSHSLCKKIVFLKGLFQDDKIITICSSHIKKTSDFVYGVLYLIIIIRLDDQKFPN